MRQKLPFVVLMCFLYSVGCRADQFVEIKAEIDINDWDFWLIRDRRHRREDEPPNIFSKSIYPKSDTIRCVVGADTWLMEGAFVQNASVTQWFTGTNIIERTVITSEELNAETKHLAAITGAVVKDPPIGSSHTRTYESDDGNPGRPIRVADLLWLRSRIAWLAFCSGPVLKRSDRKIFPPSDLWKETRAGFSYPFADKASVFEDGLGLPKRLTLYATNNQPVLEYQVAQSTNVMGWNFPLEFYLIQYVGHDTNDWLVQMTVKGKVTSIGIGTRPEIQQVEKGPER